MPQTWEHYIRGEEAAAFGRFLVEVVAAAYGCDATPDAINRAVCKVTESGAWVVFDEEGIKVGTVVDWPPESFSMRVDLAGLDCDEDSDRTLVERFRSAIAECDGFARRHRLGHPRG